MSKPEKALIESSKKSIPSSSNVSKQGSPTESTGPYLYAMGNTFIPKNTLAGIIHSGLYKVVPKEQADHYQDILERGKIVGRYGQGIKHVTKQERQNKKLEEGYEYKIKDPKEKSRLYGRKTEAEDLKAMEIETIDPFKRLLIFDYYISGHEEQHERINLTKLSNKK